MEKRFLYIILFVLALTACKGQKEKTTQETAQEVKVERSFEIPAVPMMITDPGERADYLAKNFWNKFDFADTAYIHLPDVTEQAFANYLIFLTQTSPEVAVASIKDMLKKAEAEPKVFKYFTSLCEQYLYDPNSPYRNERMYIAVLETILASPIVSEVDKIRPTNLLEMAMKNRVGQKANNFSYTTANGSTTDLYRTQAELMVLFFNDPDCSTCKEIMREISGSLLFNRLIESGRLKILAVYPDEDLESWRNHLPEMPKVWINAYDKTFNLKNEDLYDLKAIPTLYLLDKDKTVLMKDVEAQQLAEYLVQFVN